MSSISKPKGRRYYRIDFYHPLTGKRVVRSLRVETLKSAQGLQRTIDERLQMVRLGQLRFNEVFQAQSADALMSELIDDFVTYLDSPRCQITSERKREIHKYHMQRFKEDWGHMPVAEFDKDVVELDLIEALRDAKVSESYLRVILASYMRCMTFATKDRKWRKVVKFNPFAGTIPKNKNNKVARYFQPWEKVQILEYFTNPERPFWAQCYFPLLLDSGCRPGNLITEIKWKHVSLEMAQFKLFTKGKWVYVDVGELGLWALKRAAQHRNIKDDRVFWQVNGYEALKSQWRRARDFWERPDNDYEPIEARLHDFRSNYAIWFLLNGGDIYNLMAQVGWSDWRSSQPYIRFVKQSNQLKEQDKIYLDAIKNVCDMCAVSTRASSFE